MAEERNKRNSRENESLQPVFKSPMQQMNDFFSNAPFGSVMSSIDSFFQRHAMEQFGGFPVDLYETSSDWVVKAELPGVRKENIHIDTFSDRMRISVVDNQDSEVYGENNYYQRERRMQHMQRDIQIPYRIIREKTKARFLNGVLEVRGPKYPKTRNTLDIE